VLLLSIATSAIYHLVLEFADWFTVAELMFRVMLKKKRICQLILMKSRIVIQ